MAARVLRVLQSAEDGRASLEYIPGSFVLLAASGSKLHHIRSEDGAFCGLGRPGVLSPAAPMEGTLARVCRRCIAEYLDLRARYELDAAPEASAS